MCPRNSLQIVLRIPVRIKNNNHSGFRQIDSQTSSFGRQQEHSELVVLIEPLNTCDSILAFHSASQHLASHLFVVQKILNYVYHTLELAENQHFMSFISVLVYELIEQLKLTGTFNSFQVYFFLCLTVLRDFFLNSLKQVKMVAAFAKLHVYVVEVDIFYRA
jgi:hypothetical protein